MCTNSFDLEIQSETKYLASSREALQKFLEEKAYFPKDIQDSILVAMGEACTNCIRHSYHNEAGHKIHITAADKGDRVVFKIRDYGQKFNPGEIKKPELPPKRGGGLGLYFMQTIMDEMKYNTDLPDGNELVLTKYKKGEPPK